MRIHRHDWRDISLAFSLGFDLRRVGRAVLALCWTAIAIWLVLATLGWRITDEMLTAESVYFSVSALMALPPGLKSLAILLCIATGWWGGFAYLCAPILRSAAVDIALDERGDDTNVPLLNRQAAFSPMLAMLLPAACAVCVLLWALLTLIPGDFGAVVAVLSSPIALLLAVIGAAFLVVAVAASPMMAPTAVVEGRDYLEAVSRPMSYVMQRPGRYAMYWLAKIGVVGVSAAVGVLVMGLAWACLAGALCLVGQSELVGQIAEVVTARETDQPTTDPMVMGLSVVAWFSAIVLIAWLMVISLTADLIIYLLMRYRIDGVTFDKVTIAAERLKRFKNAVETADEAEEARKRFDVAQAGQPKAT